MNRPLSEALQHVYNRMELNGSVYISLDDACKYGEITKAEHHCCDRIVSRWIRTLGDVAKDNKSAKRIAFKRLIRDTKQNESLSIR